MTVWPLHKLNAATSEQLEILSNHIEIKRFVTHLIHPLAGLTPTVYIAFSKVEGWKNAFECHFVMCRYQLAELLTYLHEANLLTRFIREFGEDRLSSLKSKSKDENDC